MMKSRLFFLSSAALALALAAAPVAHAQDDGKGAPSPDETLRIIFMHNSVGIFWLHPNNGGLETALEDPSSNDYLFDVHDARRVDTIGENSKVQDFPPKFETMMDLILTFDESPDIYYGDPGMTNHIVMFKSCYGSSDIVEEGEPPGDPTHWKRTIWNYKAVYLACAEVFKRRPDLLFIAVSAPPRNRLEQRYTTECGLNAWTFNEWLAGEFVENYRKETGLNNLAVFDLFGAVLANPKTHQYPGALKEIYVQGESDSHPNQAGNLAATDAFIPFINLAVADWLQFRAGKHVLRASAADSVPLRLDAGGALAHRPYIVLGSASGVFPGLLYQGLHVPLNRDAFFDRVWQHGSSPRFVHFQGELDGQGRAAALLRTLGPIDPRLAGRVFHFAYIAGAPAQLVSGAVPIVVTP